MPFVMLGFALLVPRVVVGLLYFFTYWFSGVFSSGWWLVAGVLFLPTSLLWYSVVYHWFGGSWDIIPVVGMIISLVIDVLPARKGRAMELAAS